MLSLHEFHCFMYYTLLYGLYSLRGHVLRQIHRLIRSEFSTECDLRLLLSGFSIFSLPQGHLLAAYIFFLVFPSFLHYNNVFAKAVPTQNCTDSLRLIKLLRRLASSQFCHIIMKQLNIGL